ncbi:hypothetical protein JJV70_15690 [Streptomyces sp. JJ66]|uniref:hypothetical protein n=1 Tax=Streptomyces sp. JJ66 TaxID=2803843 RepID=UPI001C5A5A74|nr:hypothetical protein [Streptomyces sp. JJ66]MBW1603520.1 hypothetical protein [Streptomyces sp. JJ66]
MIAEPTAPSVPHGAGLGPRYVLIPVHGYGIAVATVARMLDVEGNGVARVLAPNEAIPYGAQPVLLAETTVYGAVCVERLLQAWGSAVHRPPKPWLVLVSDAPARPAAPARYRFRALHERVVGVARIPYLPSLRTVEDAEAALEHKDVQIAAAKLRRQLEGK